MKSISSKLLPAVLILVAATLVACPTASTGTPVVPAPQGDKTADTTPPTLVSSIPANGAVNAMPEIREQSKVTVVVFNFNEPMSTLSKGPKVSCSEQVDKTDSICDDVNGYSLDWSNDAKTLTMTFYDVLASASKVKFAFLPSDNQDKSGNPMAATSVEFTLADVIAPRLTSSIPEKEAKDVPVNLPEISFTFNEAIDPATFTVNCINYYVGVKQCDIDLAALLGPATWFGGGRTVVFKLTKNLVKNSGYTVIPLGKDLAGNALPDTRAGYNYATQVLFTTVAQ